MGSPSLRSDVGPLFALAMGRDCGHLLVYTTALHVLSSSTKTTCSAICSLAHSFVLSFAGGADIPCCIWCTRTYVVLYVWLDFGHAWVVCCSIPTVCMFRFPAQDHHASDLPWLSA